jgi:hypothetical protein
MARFDFCVGKFVCLCLFCDDVLTGLVIQHQLEYQEMIKNGELKKIPILTF